MMFMINKVFLDSSILVEYAKGSKTDLLNVLLEDESCQLYIDTTVLSEYAYHFLGNKGGKSPRALKENQSIPDVLATHAIEDFLSVFIVLPNDSAITPLYLALMKQYNLLPNDALILASCQLHQIPAVASYDPDFKLACQQEGLKLLQSVHDLV